MTKLNKLKKAATYLVCVALASIANGQTFKSLDSFDIANGASPDNTVFVQGHDGNLYGTTYYGGDGNDCNDVNEGCGTVFRIGPLGKLTTLYSFCTQPDCPDGSQPAVGLVLAADGDFYGVTSYTLFRITPQGNLTTLHHFCSEQNCVDGSYPDTPLVQATDGNLYGTTSGGGTGNMGTVFRITPQGKLTTLYNFGGSAGSAPSGALIQASDGNLYGATAGGGAGNQCGRNGGCGTIFKMTLGGN